MNPRTRAPAPELPPRLAGRRGEARQPRHKRSGERRGGARTSAACPCALLSTGRTWNWGRAGERATRARLLIRRPLVEISSKADRAGSDSPGMSSGTLRHRAFVLLLASLPACMDPMRTGRRAFERGDGDLALEAWQPIAERGDAKAQYLVGLVRDEGRGTRRDAQEAARWYALAAEQGHA